jgi:hypothetical protein
MRREGGFWEIVSVDQRGTPTSRRRRASNKRPGSKSMQTGEKVSDAQPSAYWLPTKHEKKVKTSETKGVFSAPVRPSPASRLPNALGQTHKRGDAHCLGVAPEPAAGAVAQRSIVELALSRPIPLSKKSPQFGMLLLIKSAAQMEVIGANARSLGNDTELSHHAEAIH